MSFAEYKQYFEQSEPNPSVSAAPISELGL